MMIVFHDPAKIIRAGYGLGHRRPPALRQVYHTGLAVVSDLDVFGNVVNVASRIAGQAEGGEFLISSDLHDAAAEHSGLTFAGPEKAILKGIEQAGLV